MVIVMWILTRISNRRCEHIQTSLVELSLVERLHHKASDSLLPLLPNPNTHSSLNCEIMRIARSVLEVKILSKLQLKKRKLGFEPYTNLSLLGLVRLALAVLKVVPLVPGPIEFGCLFPHLIG